ncbi:MAG: DUF2780 domain-containing protein [Armatimonadota bacterium]
MKDFISKVVSSMDVEPETARSAAGALLRAGRENLSSDDYAKIAQNVEGVDELIAQAPQETEPEGGLKETARGVLGQAAEALGAEKAGSMGIGALLGLAGLKPDQMPGFVQMFLEHLRQKVGSDVVGNMLSKMSGLLDLESGDVSV